MWIGAEQHRTEVAEYGMKPISVGTTTARLKDSLTAACQFGGPKVFANEEPMITFTPASTSCSSRVLVKGFPAGTNR